MRTRRPISINNSLAHGICNYSCRLCAINKPGYSGPKQFQDVSTTCKLIERIEEAQRDGLRVRYVANAGDGEPTLHPEFGEILDLFGDMTRRWRTGKWPAPEVSVVTNGSRLSEDLVLDALALNRMTLIVSVPTLNPDHYGLVMAGDEAKGAALLGRVIRGLAQAMSLPAECELRALQIHVSPPDREIVMGDIDETVRGLAGLAGAAGLKNLDFILFPATSNRAGLVVSRTGGVDLYESVMERYNGKIIQGVRVGISLSFRRFFPTNWEFVDLLRSFDYPCVWNSQLFITAAGDSICCNDQSVRNPLGNIHSDSLQSLLERKERFLPGIACRGCDQSPLMMNGTGPVRTYARLARARMAWTRFIRRTAGGRAGRAEAIRKIA